MNSGGSLFEHFFFGFDRSHVLTSVFEEGLCRGKVRSLGNEDHVLIMVHVLKTNQF